MKRSCRLAIFLAMALLFMNAMPAAAFEIGARALYWFPAFKADMKVNGAGLSGDNLNLKDDLDVGNSSFPSFEAFGGLGKHNLSLAYTPMDYSGSTRLGRRITFNGQTFAAGSKVDTDLKLRMVDLEYRYTLLDAENILAGFSLGAIGKIKYVDGEAKLSSAGKVTSDTIRLPVPMVGLGARIGILFSILEARAKATGVAYPDNYLYEGMADLAFTPFPFLDVTAGYRVMRMRIDRNDTFLDSEFAGPYIGLTVGF
ncbi:MAG: porin family protein [Syntrophales bacterium]